MPTDLPPLTHDHSNPAPHLLDTSGLGDIPHAPLIPEKLLRAHGAFISTDSRFRASARLLQSLWRQDQSLPSGTFRNGNGKRLKLGSRLSQDAARAGGNFLGPDIFREAQHALTWAEIGALLEPRRLMENLLSSSALVFNIFAPLRNNLRLATDFMNQLFPGFMDEVIEIRYEHSPGRGRELFCGDYTAFDLVFRGRRDGHRRCLVAFEIKYSESCTEPTPTTLHPRHFEIAASSGLYYNWEDLALSNNPLQQFWRSLNLEQSMLDAEIVDEAKFILLAPQLNHLVQQAGQDFAEHLTPPAQGRAEFGMITLERTWQALAAIGLTDHAAAGHRRYSDFWQLAGEVDLFYARQRETRPFRQTAAHLHPLDEPAPF